MEFVDDTTSLVIGARSILGELTPRSPAGVRALESLPLYRSGAQAEWTAEVERLATIDDWWSGELERTLSEAFDALPALERPLRLLEAGERLDEVALFELKRFLYRARSIVAAAAPTLDFVEGGWLEHLERLMTTIHPEKRPSPRFRIASRLDERLAGARAAAKRARTKERELRRALEQELVDELGGRFDVRGHFAAEAAVASDDPRLRPVGAGKWALVDARLRELADEAERRTDSVSDIEAEVRDVLSEELRRELGWLREVRDVLGALDFGIARIELRRKWDGTWGEWSDESVTIVDGRHPSLLEAIARDEIQAISVTLDTEASVVTGPNMGGKSLLLRLIGVCQWCAQHALPIPAKRFVFQPVSRIVYVGSEEPGRPAGTGLSAFGREVRRVVDAWDDSPGALWLLDEFGRGTHPEEGAAIAGDLLRELAVTGNRVVFATHFPALASMKGVAHFRIAGLSHPETLRALDGGAGDLATIEAALRGAMDYRPLRTVADAKAVPRDARIVARALGLTLGEDADGSE